MAMQDEPSHFTCLIHPTDTRVHQLDLSYLIF